MSFQHKLAKVAVLGAGSWGTTIAIHLHNLNHPVAIWEYYPENVALLSKTRRNPLLEGIPIPAGIQISNDLEKTVVDSAFIVIAVPSHTMRKLLLNLSGLVAENAFIVNLSKGIEQDSLFRMSELIHHVLPHPLAKIVTLSGPSHAEEVAREIPTAVVAASENIESARGVQELFNSHYLRVYTSTDIIGVELGGSLKNVIAIAAGICDGLGLGDNSKAALITRGLMEITRMGVYLGAEEATFAGLSGVGDLIVTCGSKHSRNRYVGEEIGKGRRLDDIINGMSMVAEGVQTCRTVQQMIAKYGILMPISAEIHKVLFEEKDPRLALNDLMTRDPVDERHSIPGN
ncbi:MAG TPA: NAD(P)-dependent glycerol-3-phosphate dehydrogenase [Candidatus Marinimicrobia bacterium]|nr:NAD(P)-dependent glycerol-3-phosphate dehydrogenase [Candidatus Neomarinimicrobiota bacterium]